MFSNLLCILKPSPCLVKLYPVHLISLFATRPWQVGDVTRSTRPTTKLTPHTTVSSNTVDPARVPIPTEICFWAVALSPRPDTSIIMLSGTTPETGRMTPPMSAGATPRSRSPSAPSEMSLAPYPRVMP